MWVSRKTPVLLILLALGANASAASKAELEARIEQLERKLDSRSLMDMLDQMTQLQNQVQQLRGDIEVQTIRWKACRSASVICIWISTDVCTASKRVGCRARRVRRPPVRPPLRSRVRRPPRRLLQRPGPMQPRQPPQPSVPPSSARPTTRDLIC